MYIKFLRKSLAGYLDMLADRTSVPGGGSAAALVAAIGAGLVLMAARYSRKVPSRRLRLLDTCFKRLRKNIEEDSRVYWAWDQARRRHASIRVLKRLRARTQEVPTEVIREAQRAEQSAKQLKASINPYLLSDFKMGLRLLRVAQSALRNDLLKGH